MSDGTKMVRLARSQLNCRCHVCAFFHSREDEYKILVPFMKEGLDAGDRAVQVIGAEHRAEQIRRLTESGVDASAAEQSGQLEVLTWENAVLRGGRFDQYAMIGALQEIATEGERQGFAITRIWANMGWALGDFPGVHDIVEYESRLNYVLPNYDIAAVCTYDVTQFSAIVMDILRTHPQVIIGGVLRENPFYVAPDEFLLELRGGSIATP